MPDKRYHIHLICAPDDQVSVLDGLELFLENHAFLTKELHQNNEESISYSKRCIDKCDFVILLVGDTYGTLTNTGISQLHLSYVYAHSKSRPIMALLKLYSAEADLSRQLTDFVSMVEKEYSESIYYYDEEVVMSQYIAPAFKKFLADSEIDKDDNVGWLSTVVFNEKLKEAEEKIKELSVVAKEQQPTPASLVEKLIDGGASKKLNNQFKSDVHTTFQVGFTTQAFQDGNLSEVTLNTTLTWLQVLKAIDKLPPPVGQSSFQRAINELVHSKALQLVQLKFSRVHAVSRTSVLESDLTWIHSQLLELGWLSKNSGLKPSGMRSSYESMQLTHKGILAIKSQ